MRILFVGTGNTYRSLLAEGLTRAFLLESPRAAVAGISTASAGLQAWPGEAMEPAPALALARRGGRPEGLVTRRLTPEMLQAADLTLTMTRDQRRAALELAPRTMFRTYTLREAAELLRSVDLGVLPAGPTADERGRAVVAALGARRATRPRTDRAADDLNLPADDRAASHREVARQLEESLTPLLRSMRVAAGRIDTWGAGAGVAARVA